MKETGYHLCRLSNLQRVVNVQSYKLNIHDNMFIFKNFVQF